MKKFFLSLALTTLLFSSEQQDAVSQMNSEFDAYKKSQQKEFTDYKTALNKEYVNYKKELSKSWRDPKLSTKKDWVSYTPDKKSRSIVDFKNSSYTVEAIAKSPKEAKVKLSERIAYIASKNTQEVVKTDLLQKKVAQISAHTKTVTTSKVDSKPILSDLIFSHKPTKSTTKRYVKAVLKKNKITHTKAKDGKSKVYKITVKLPKNTHLKLAQKYSQEVVQNSKKFKLPYELIFAIIQTESDFNPFAKSYIPAYGLMQIVPRTAGADVFKTLYKKHSKPSATYLYNSKNNIRMGTAYLNILYYRYLKKIKNPISRLYCTIAAYNTGAGNIAYAFIGNYNINRASSKINALTPDEVYNRLLSDLKYDEPKYYLKRVNRRMKVYKEAYAGLM